MVLPLSILHFPYSAIGVKTISAKVNHKLVPISHKLHSGDQVEIITSNKQKASEDWLSFVVTSRAKGRIRDALKEEKKKWQTRESMQCNESLKGLGVSFVQHNVKNWCTGIGVVPTWIFLPGSY
ncbi:MAG: bifunctional (p)ppGpp synthetase/guanosine-3',5'-bis(diphosphate) 3'-pyrophosphohydrolase [Chitinophagaceae bacterium]|nr:bifunctional (p)ppGpp synthetase/guanosine-3',5'-bis(diphosphate) 3'-pyrophosphohydrolase [Chitinophagaceae bacterium]